jgi:hypothetical protein
MSYYRGTVLILLACAVLFLFSCARSASRNPHVAPAGLPGSVPGLVASSAEYPNTTEGLQSRMNDMLAAAKRGDRQRVDALIKQTEFSDYARYFVHTYSPDPLVAEDWNITYRRYVSDNEDQLRELLETLAKDEDGRILVRKANDNPALGRGFEWGMVHYARIPIDVYCVTLVFSHSPDGPGESSGYYVYADGMFRWDSIVPFAKPGTYQSAPDTLNESQTQAAGSAQYPNNLDGLREFLSELRAAAKSGDQVKVDSMIKQTEIPEYRNWFLSVYVPGSGLSWAIPYGNNLVQNEQSFKALWEKLAQDDGEIRVRKLVDKPGGNRDLEWGMIHNSRTPLDIYHASWKSRTGAPDEWIGYLIYIDGMFRFDSLVRRVSVVRVSPASNR